MQTVRRAALAGLGVQLLVLTVLAVTVGLGRAGWVLGGACGIVVNGSLLRARRAGRGTSACHRPIGSPWPGPRWWVR